MNETNISYLSAFWGPSGQPGSRSAPAGRTCAASAAADSCDATAVGDDDGDDGGGEGELAGGWGGRAAAGGVRSACGAAAAAAAAAAERRAGVCEPSGGATIRTGGAGEASNTAREREGLYTVIPNHPFRSRVANDHDRDQIVELDCRQQSTLRGVRSVVILCYVFFQKFRLPMGLHSSWCTSPTACGT